MVFEGADHEVLDFASDAGQQVLHKIATKHEMPSYVLGASLESLQMRDEQSCAALLPVPRLSCHSKEATWLSHAYFVEQFDQLPEHERVKIERELDKQASFWGIDEDVRRLIENERDLLIKAASYSDEEFPLRNAEEVRAAASWFVKNAKLLPTRYSLAIRSKLASDILAADKQLGSQLGVLDQNFLLRAACSRGCYDGAKVADYIRRVPTSLHAEERDKLAEICQPLRGDEMQVKHAAVARVLEAIAPQDAHELKMATGYTGPIVTLGNGAVFAKHALDAAPRELLDGQSAANKLAMNVPQTLAGEDLSKTSVEEAYRLCKWAATNNRIPLLKPCRAESLASPLAL